MLISARILAVFVVFACSGAVAADKIISTGLCVDQWLLAMTSSGQIAGLSPLAADENVSWQWQKARVIKQIAPDIEAIMAAQPDLVVFDAYGQRQLEEKIKSYGVATYRLHEITDLRQLPALADEIARKTGSKDNAQAQLLQQLADIQPCVECRAAILLWDGNYASGNKGVIGGLLRRAGYAIMEQQDQRMGLEKILLSANSLDAHIIRAENYGGLPSMAEERSAHPVFASLPEKKIDARTIICAGPSTPAALEVLRESN